MTAAAKFYSYTYTCIYICLSLYPLGIGNEFGSYLSFGYLLLGLCLNIANQNEL